MTSAKRYALGAWNAGRAARGYVHFKRTGTQAPNALMGLRGMFTADPRLPRCAANLLGLVTRRPRVEQPVTGVLGSLDRPIVDAIVKRLDTDGYMVFDATLAGDAVATITREITELPAYAALVLGAPVASSETLDRRAPRASRYDLDAVDLVDVASVQALIVDPTLSAVADAYLRRDAILTSVSAWRSFPFGDAPSSAAAQLFHSDRDHLRFLKFFVYLTDVTTTTGPHVFVRGSHRHRPVALRRDVRFGDDDVLAGYGTREVVELCGTAGTIMAVDTSGLHKGKLPVDDERLILQFEFGTSQFGTPVSTMPFRPRSDDVARRLAANPRKFAMLTTASPDDGPR
jgi:hypothetical protein